MSTSTRIPALDSLRAGAMLLGILIHALNAYRTDFSFIWSVQDASRSLIADYLGHVIHAFRMPLFFILSGFLTHVVHRRVTQREFLAKRFHRVVLPLLAGWVGRRLGAERLARLGAWLARRLTGPLAALPLSLATLSLLYKQSLTLYSWSVGTQLSIFLPFPFFLLGFLEVNMLGYYFAFFALGWVLQRQPELIVEQGPRAGWHLMSGLSALTASLLPAA